MIMKVAYNACYGGFGLSPLALTKYAEKKGITLTWYEGQRDPKGYKKVSDLPHNTLFGPTPFTKDLGDWFLSKDLDNDLCYYPRFYDEARSDPDLIAVIEELGSKEASRQCADLQIHEVPDGREFEIDEYDGNESVVPPRQCW